MELSALNLQVYLYSVYYLNQERKVSMAKQCQIVAVVSGKKTRLEKEFGEANKTVQKGDLFSGLSRTYSPLDEGGEMLPAEKKLPQQSVNQVVGHVRSLLNDIMDAIATQEYGNTTAKADIKVEGKAILTGVPVTVMLYLEKQLDDMRTFVGNLPTLDPAERWVKNAQTGYFELEEAQKSVRTKKVQKPLVLYPATEKHPAQTQLITEDITAGSWTIQKSSTAVADVEKKAILSRITKLADAVKAAREEANGMEVKEQQIAAPILQYVFEGLGN